MKTARFPVFVALFCFWASGLYAQTYANPLGLTEEERVLLEAKQARSPFGISLGLSQTLGAASFNSDPGVRRTSLDSNLQISPFWRVTNLMRLSASLGTAVALIENYDTNTTRRNQVFLSDLTLGLSHARIWKIPLIDANLSGGTSLGFPTSIQSQYRQLILSMRSGFALSRSFGPLYTSLGFSAFKNLNRYTTPTLSREEVGDHVILAHFRGNEHLTSDLVSLGGNNTSFGLGSSVHLGWNIIEPLTLSVQYSLGKSWTYRSFDNDEYASVYADAGRGDRDSQSGVVDLNWQFNQVYSLSLGVHTATAPKTADNKSWIFPFMNFSNNHRANTGIYASLGATF